MPTLKKRDHLVETSVATEVTNLKARGYVEVVEAKPVEVEVATKTETAKNTKTKPTEAK